MGKKSAMSFAKPYIFWNYRFSRSQTIKLGKGDVPANINRRINGSPALDTNSAPSVAPVDEQPILSYSIIYQ